MSAPLRLTRPIIASMLKPGGGPLNVRVQDRSFFRELIEERPSRARLLVERKGHYEDIGSSNVQYGSAQQVTGLPRIQLLTAHREWILKTYGRNPVDDELIIEDPFVYVLRNPGSIAK